MSGAIAVSATALSAVAQIPCASSPCAIDLRRIATLRSSNQPDLIPDFQAPVVRDERGRYFTSSRTRTQILAFDSAGNLAAVIGKPGSGPGQFQRVSAVLAGPRGSVLAYDIRSMKLTVFSPELEVVKTASLPFLTPPRLALDGERIVFAEHVRTPELVGFPIHVADGSGRILRSFGADVPQYRPDIRPVIDRVVGTGHSRSIWAAPPGRYILERWDPASGRRLGRVDVRSGWFVESTRTSVDERVRPKPLIESLWEADGLVWVLIRDADSAWKPPPMANVERVRSLQEYYDAYDWVLEAVDPSSGRVVATRRFPEGHWARPGPYLSSFAVSNAGTRSIEVWRPALVGRR